MTRPADPVPASRISSLLTATMAMATAATMAHSAPDRVIARWRRVVSRCCAGGLISVVSFDDASSVPSVPSSPRAAGSARMRLRPSRPREHPQGRARSAQLSTFVDLSNRVRGFLRVLELLVAFALVVASGIHAHTADVGRVRFRHGLNVKLSDFTRSGISTTATTITSGPRGAYASENVVRDHRYEVMLTELPQCASTSQLTPSG